MFTFVFDELLFRAQSDNPAFAVLFHLPPTRAKARPVSLYYIFKVHVGVIPHSPQLKSFFKKPRPDDHARVRRVAAQMPERQPGIRGADPPATNKGYSLSSCLIVVISVIIRSISSNRSRKCCIGLGGIKAKGGWVSVCSVIRIGQLNVR